MPGYAQWGLAVLVLVGSVVVLRDGLRRRPVFWSPGAWMFGRILFAFLLVVVLAGEVATLLDSKTRAFHCGSPADAAAHFSGVLLMASFFFLVFRAPKPPPKEPGPPKPIPRDLV